MAQNVSSYVFTLFTLILINREVGAKNTIIPPHEAQDIARKYIGMAHAYDIQMKKEYSLHTKADQYIEFINNFGSLSQAEELAVMEFLFTKECNKVINGRVVAKDRAALYDQLNQGKSAVGNWSVKAIGTRAVNTQENCIVIQYVITTEKYGSFTVIKYLTLKDDLIDHINEVCNSLDA